MKAAVSQPSSSSAIRGSHLSFTPNVTSPLAANLQPGQDSEDDAQNKGGEENQESVKLEAVELEDQFGAMRDDPQYTDLLWYPTICKSDKLKQVYRECVTLPKKQWRQRHVVMATQNALADLIKLKEIEAAMDEKETPVHPSPHTDEKHRPVRNETVLLPRFPEGILNPAVLRTFKQQIELYEQSGQYHFDRTTGISQEHQSVVQTLLDMSRSEEAMRLHWRDKDQISSESLN